MKPLRKLFAAALAVALVLSFLPCARASEALGHDLAASGVTLNEGAALASGTFWSDSHSDLRQENYVVYTPGGRVKPLVTCGATTRALLSVPDAARELEAQGLRVVAGINGDYYDTAYGMPLGTTMVNGELRNAHGNAYYAVGFRADGSAIIGDPALQMQVLRETGETFPVFTFNYIRQSEYGIYLYDSRFNSRGTTGTSEPGVDVRCSVADGALRIGGTLTLCVEEVLPEATDTAVPEGQYVLTANLRAGEEYTAPLLALQPGELLALRVEACDERWNDVENLLGAPELILENGAPCAGLPSGSAPRTAIGQRADGSLILYTIDGRQGGYSIGATLTAVAMRLAELGCVTAVALDGGGSTTLTATLPDQTAARLVNIPSDPVPRAVSNHLFLVASNAPSGIPDHIYLAPAARQGLPGAQIPVTAAVVDTNYIPMDAPVALSADKGFLSGSALTLPGELGTVTLTARSGNLSASTMLESAAPDRIVVTANGRGVTSLTLAQREAAALAAVGYRNHLRLAGGSECFDWRFDGDAGTVEGLTFTAAASAAVGSLNVSAAGLSVSLPITVAAKPIRLLDDFETGFEPISSPLPAEGEEDSGARATLSFDASAAQAYLGRAAARLDYILPGEGSVTLPLSHAIPSGYDRIELWARGEGGTALAFETDAGAAEALEVGAEWTHLSFILPGGARSVTGLTLRADAAAEGTLRLDQLVLAYGAEDVAAPGVELAYEAETNTLSGRAFDAFNGAALPTLRLTLDGKPLEFTFDDRTGAIFAALPAYDGLTHHAALVAGDSAGNLSRASVVLPAAPDAEPAFPDMAGHWAAGAVEFLKRTGVSNGSDGGLYKPDTNITRQEFATMLCRYLAPAEDFSGTALPFADASEIASWALDAAKAMYALGVVNGSKEADGSLRYNPRANITRREAAAMLGRLLDKGFIAPAAPYVDAADIPAWASEHVAVLAALGVFDDFVTDAFLPTQPLTRAEMAAMLLRLR